MASLRAHATALPVALGVALIPAGPALAAPECTDIGPATRLCATAGHTQIVTSPNPALTNPYPGWGYGVPGFLLGGGGFWIGF